ncbi:MAG: tripartite tricarboxylate transporter substrate-binding protein [Pigmentiphaga sp.]|uniref:tripartite tricarboxylate transporter substrate-binding protein n=1 Tax=Pigmentiphaga sp. TaxID=1977564 RepID=UPI0029A0FDDF|nr:tripartite tricarboxylate transporter substrate-binding protein [Pigmentiphaga sp.]MDX3906319.1 tripartite tricarboxylate transporter substrate-binding protein [Pigmentiphaga sp.]
MQRRNVLIALAATAAAACRPAFAQDSKAPIRIVVGLAAGGTLDLVGRVLADKLRVSLGRPVVVENKLGAGQRVAMNEVRRAAPDGRTIFVGTTSPLTTYPHIYTKLDYDPVKDFTPIARVAQFDTAIATGPATNARDMKELIAWLRANKNAASYATPGAGTVPQFLGVAFGQAIGVDLTHVPYNGSTPALTDIVAGRVPVLVTSLSDITELHRAGKLRILGVANDQRSPVVPDVPTLKEAGIPLSFPNTVAIYGPANIPPQIVRELNEAAVQAVNARDVREKLAGYGIITAPSSPEQLAAIQAADLKLFGPLVKASGYVGQ